MLWTEKNKVVAKLANTQHKRCTLVKLTNQATLEKCLANDFVLQRGLDGWLSK